VFNQRLDYCNIKKKVDRLSVFSYNELKILYPRLFCSYAYYSFCMFINYLRPPLWCSGQSSWLHIRRPGFDSRHYQKKIVGL
jgi:hypothetical protein